MRKATPTWQLGSKLKQGMLPTCLFLMLALAGNCAPQTVPSRPPGELPRNNIVDSHGSTGLSSAGLTSAGSSPAGSSSAGSSSAGSVPADNSEPDPITQWQGLPVREIAFEGVTADRLQPLAGHLPQAVGTPLNREDVASSLRALFQTGLFSTIEADATRIDDGVKLVFRGAPREFIGTVTVDGAKGATINAQLQAASRLNAGTRFTQTRLDAALGRMRQALADNGFNEPIITYKLTRHASEQLVDIAFEVNSGVQARVGAVKTTGDSGLTEAQFRQHAHLKDGKKIDHDTHSRALSGVLKHYQKEDRLEADVKLESELYVPATKRSDFTFSANRGPVVKVSVEGAKVGSDRLKRLVPIFEEGTVDEDLLNEGNRRLRDYFQRLGYFDVKVDHSQQNPGGNSVNITFTVTLGARRRVSKVSVEGNHYFDAATLEALLSVHAADHLDRHGAYSQALVAADISALQAVYQNNGFSKMKVTPETTSGGTRTTPAAPGLGRNSTEPIAVIYHIDEGRQQRVGELQLMGVEKSDQSKLLALMNTAPGQLFSPQNLAGDRDALLTDYLSRGFGQAQVDVEEHTEENDPAKVDVTFNIHEGQQIFVRKVLISGLHYTRPDTVAKAITLHPGDPLNQTALAQTQRNLYEFALFNEVNTAIENPAGSELNKTILIQTTEARRWTLTYGLGFEAQTGTPQNNCRGIATTGAPCSPNGKTGISPRVLGAVTRNNLFGRDQSASIQGTYGLLEQNINLLFQNPHFLGNRDLGFTFSGGYASSQNVTTYVASKLETGVRWTEHFSQPGSWFSKANTFVYEFDFRRVKVAAETLQVGPSEISKLSTAVRVAGPSLTWIRDTRDSALDSRRGTYTSFQDFFSNHTFGAEAQFNRLDVSSSSYYGFDKGRLVVARNTRYGQERAYGSGSDELIPLPERLYAGGPTSHRGFAINAAGPRDPETGFPIGGAGALVNSTELRLPPPLLPFFGDAVSFVLFHDMGNVFTNAGNAWASALRIQQPNRDACKVTTPATPQPAPLPPIPPSPTGPTTSTGQQGQCSFDYFSHAAGLGMRYHTPVGPIRLDFSYNLNPPIYPVNINYSIGFSPTNPLGPYSNPHVGEAPHFNFFFSLGQTF